MSDTINLLITDILRTQDAAKERMCQAALDCGYTLVRSETTIGHPSGSQEYPVRLIASRDGEEFEVARWWTDFGLPFEPFVEHFDHKIRFFCVPSVLDVAGRLELAPAGGPALAVSEAPAPAKRSL